MREELATALTAGVVVLLLESGRFIWHLVRLWRQTPGVLHTIRIPTKLDGSAGGWFFTIDEERWRRCPRGWALAVHMSAENHTGEDAIVPDFLIRSGAATAIREVQLCTGKLGKNLAQWPLTAISAGSCTDAWMICSLHLRFLGGRPGYRVVARELGDWRGLTRLVEEGPRAREVDEAGLIVEELANHRYWGEQCAEHARANLSAASGGSVYRQIEETETRRYQRWAQGVVDYLRDRVGAEYRLQFEATPETGMQLLERIEHKTRLLDQWIGEFRVLSGRQ